MDKTSVVGWASFGIALYFFWRFFQGLCGYDHKTEEFTWMTAFYHWVTIALLIGGLIYLGG